MARRGKRYDFYREKVRQLREELAPDIITLRQHRAQKITKSDYAYLMSEEEIENISDKKMRLSEYKKEYQILSGKFELSVARQWKKNVSKALENMGASAEFIAEFKRNVRLRDVAENFEEYFAMNELFVPYKQGTVTYHGGIESTDDEIAIGQFIDDYIELQEKRGRNISSEKRDDWVFGSATSMSGTKALKINAQRRRKLKKG